MVQRHEILQTPEERFENLTQYPFKSHYVFVEQGLRMHYVDEGENNQPVILLLHGEPSWSYLYRHMIPPLVSQGYRVIAPDLVGFGKSDKFMDKSMYTYSNHTYWLTRFIEVVKLENIHLFCHDWGGMIALRIVAHYPDLFSTVIASYAFLFTGKEPIPESFKEWQHFSQTDPDFLAGNIVASNTYTRLSPDIHAAYNAPFPAESYKGAARQFPMMIPTDPHDREAIINTKAREKLKTFSRPFLTVWGDNKDVMWQGKDKILQDEVAGAKNQPHRILQGHHFLHEDCSSEITAIIIDFLSRA